MPSLRDFAPDTARCLFVDGPVMLFIQDAPAEEVSAAIARLQRVAYVAARLMHEEQHGKPMPTAQDSSGSTEGVVDA